jgi:hypothetical protein
VFFEWKYHEWFSGPGFPGQENHVCDISTQKIHECRFLFITCHYYKYFEAFLVRHVRIVANLIKKFKTQSSAWTDARHRDVTIYDVMPTGAMASLGHVRRSKNTHDVTEAWRRQSQCTRVIERCYPEKY